MSSSQLDRVSGGSGVWAEMFVQDGKILWKRLTTTIFGGAYFAVATGVSNFVIESAQAVGGLYSALARFFAAVVTVSLGGPASTLDASYAELGEWVASAGPLSFFFAVGSVVIIARVAAWGYNSAK